MSKENKTKKKLFKRRPKEKKLNRSMAGNTLLFVIMFICGVFMALPLVMIINNALKPLDEIYQFPPKIFVRNPTLENFSDLFVLMNSSWVPFSRYILNTIIITGGGMVGHVLCASLAAYPLKQFMEQLPDSLMESARLDGATEWRVFWSIVMPNVKPAWLTLAIFQFQQMWGNTGSLFLRNEELKPLQYALQQITAGGTARAGAAAAVTFIIAAVPIIFFLICQSNVLETMTTSGMKD